MLQPSRVWRWLLGAIAVLGAVLITSAAAHTVWMLGGLALYGLALLAPLQRYRQAQRIRRLQRRAGQWWLTIGPVSEPVEAELRAAPLISRLLCSLEFATDLGPVRLLLWPDSAAGADLRRLRASLLQGEEMESAGSNSYKPRVG